MRKLPNISPAGAGLGAAAVLAVLALLWISRRGAAGAGADLGAGVVSFAGGAVSGAVSGAVGVASDAVGLPTPSQTTTDAAVARWIADNHGWLTASLWSGAPALWAATNMPPGSGRPPPPGSPAALALVRPAVPITTGDFARNDRAQMLADLAADQAAPWRLEYGP